MTRILFSALLMMGLAIEAKAATPLPFTAQPSESSITFEATENNAVVSGTFKEFTADILFHPDALGESKVTVTVSIASVSANYNEVPTTLKTPDWFDEEQFPKAVFESASFTKLGEKEYEAKGTLTMKNHTEPAVLHFTLNQFDEKSAEATGELSLSRTKYHIGWDDTSSVKDEVKVKFHVKAAAR